MRYIIMHKTNADLEAGVMPSRALIDQVGALIDELVGAGLFLSGEGLRASALGVRLRFRGGACTAIPGPFVGENELPASFSVLKVKTREEAVEWATRHAEAYGDVELDVRPVNEAWHIGLMEKPADLTHERYMVLRKVTADSEAGKPLPPERKSRLERHVAETTRSGMHVVTENLRPSARGRRYKNAVNGISATDGPFAESKELIAGYTILKAASLEDADRWARRYLVAVEADEVDLRELED